jgi:hypothetical protein
MGLQKRLWVQSSNPLMCSLIWGANACQVRYVFVIKKEEKE